jgi:hypothetical protein
MKPCSHDSHAKYELLIEPLRAVARSLGYALTVHGSLVRDIDLVAVPWTSDAVHGARARRRDRGRGGQGERRGVFHSG